MTPQENIKRVETLTAQVKAHVMCLIFAELGGTYKVLYPAGMHPIFAGVNVGIGGAKAKALEVLLARMELHYQEGRLT